MIRLATDADSAAVIAVVSACWDEYPGCVTDISGEAPELLAPATAFAAKGGACWVLLVAGDVLGVIATWPAGDGAWEVGKIYVAAAHRGTGAARELLATAEGFAVAAGADRLELWSDTRFQRAHAFYEKHGFVRTGPLRLLGDKSGSIEFGFFKPLGRCVVRILDLNGAASAERRLSEILVACVDGGASVSFLRPMDFSRARAFWAGVAKGVALDRATLLAAWSDGVLAGCVMLNRDMPQNQPHRADVAKLLVHPAFRRRGLARALMLAVQDAAVAAGRTLLTLDTADDGAEALYRSLGWVPCGRIPGYALDVDGVLEETRLLYHQADTT